MALRESTIARQRCFNHANREAAALCPECLRTFCRECVTEHENRVLCAECLAKLTGADEKKRRLAWLAPFLQTVAAFVVLWGVFYVIGQGLMALPDEFHDTTFWSAPFDSGAEGAGE